MGLVVVTRLPLRWTVALVVLAVAYAALVGAMAVGLGFVGGALSGLALSLAFLAGREAP
jgi:hypothetical protein